MVVGKENRSLLSGNIKECLHIKSHQMISKTKLCSQVILIEFSLKMMHYCNEYVPDDL